MTAATFDLITLTRRLRAEQQGDVCVDPGARALYSTDASNYRVVPEAVVVPRTTEDLLAAATAIREAGAPMVMRGGGTSIAGNCLGGVIVDVSRHLTAILDIDPQAQTATVQPGVVLADLIAAARRHGLTFGADPSSASRATMGGMIANNACGAHTVAWGTTADNVRRLDVVTGGGVRMTLDAQGGHADPAGLHPQGQRARAEQIAAMSGPAGELHRAMAALGVRENTLLHRRFGRFSRQISGYALQHLLPERGVDLARLLCGSEGTLATTLQATVALVRPPASTVLLALGFPTSFAAADCVPDVLPHAPLTMESINATLIDRLPEDLRRAATHAGLPPGTTWLLVEVGGDDPVAAREHAVTIETVVLDAGLGATCAVVTDPRAADVLWRCRRDGTGLATRRADGAEAWAGWEDAAVPPARLGDYLRGLDELLARYGYSGASYGHFGDGCMHMRIDFDFFTEQGVARYRAFLEQATDLVTDLGGSVSGEHGDGRARSEMVARMYGAEVTSLFGEVKTAWDPWGHLNPNIIVDPLPVDHALRHRGAAAHRAVDTVFGYPNDAGSFAQAQRRCVGVGKCRQSSGGVMCPSYQVTREEQHSTRGRAHLLWEMLEGDVVRDGWRAAEVRDALDLCLSCKGCLSDCPVNVDIATYKAEFTHHHYARRPWARPRSHWSMGWLPLTARIASRAPHAVNALLRSPAAPLLRAVGGIAADRAFPTFPAQPMRKHLARLPRPDGPSRGRVVLWPDTFTAYLCPEVGVAAAKVLAAAGFEPVLPPGPVCCGLTWMSTGQLGVARRVLQRSLRVLGPQLDAGTPVVGLEPSCTAMLRHDAPNLLPGNPHARRLPHSVQTLAELLADRAPDWIPPKVGGSALVQVHCHQHAVMGFDADRALMDKAGIQTQVPDSGCCGLAGNFGFEAGHSGLSRAVGERVLLPAVRAADPGTTILADGFSCRTQISQETGRRAQHLAEVLAQAMPTRLPVDEG